MYPTQLTPEFYASVRNIHHATFMHGTHRISTRETFYDLIFHSKGETDTISLPMRIERNQVFTDNETQDAYYAGHRSNVNMKSPPSYYLRHHFQVQDNEIPKDPIFRNFIADNVGKFIPSNEFEFFGSLKSGRWFFRDGMAGSYESDVMDNNTLLGLQFYFFNRYNTEVDNSLHSQGLESVLRKIVQVNSVDFGSNFWYYTAFVVFKPGHSVSIDNDVTKTVYEYLKANHFELFGHEFLSI